MIRINLNHRRRSAKAPVRGGVAMQVIRRVGDSPGPGPSRTGVEQPRELGAGGAESDGRRSRAHGGRRRRRWGGARGEGATNAEGARGRMRQHRLAIRNTNPGSTRAESHCGDRDMVDGGAALELHGDMPGLATEKG